MLLCLFHLLAENSGQREALKHDQWRTPSPHRDHSRQTLQKQHG